MDRDLFKPLGFLIALVCLGVAGVVLLPRVLGMAGGPEAQLVTQLKRSERQGFSAAVKGSRRGPLVATRHSYERLSFQIDLASGKAEAAATLNFDGRLGDSTVSSLGVEKVDFSFVHGEWKPDEGFAPRLSAVVSALERRRAAIERGDLKAIAQLVEDGEDGGSVEPALSQAWTLERRRYQVRAWFIRMERDAAAVSEEYRLSGDGLDRPVDDRGIRTLTLRRRGREFFFSERVM